MLTHPPLTLTFPDRADWVLAKVLAHRAGTHADKVFLREAEGAGRSWTFRRMHDAANAVGRSLLDRGFVPGDRLTILLDNCPEYVLAWFGASMVGVVESPMNPEYKGYFLEHSMNLMGPRGVVTSPRFVPVFVASREKIAPDLSYFVVGEGPEVEDAVTALRAAGWRAERFDALLEAPSDRHDVDLPRHELGAIISTSGTTGPSKGVMMSHSQLYLFADEQVNVVRLSEDDVYQCALPLFHGNSQFLAVYPSLIVGATVVLYERFSPTRFLDRVREAGITVTNFVGVMMDWVSRQPRTAHDADTTLRCVMSAPAPAPLVPGFCERFGVEAVATVFGQTEICMPFLAPYGVPRPDGAVGVPVDEFFEVRLVDPETDEEVPVGEMGELVIRPREPWTINSGYFGMPEATADARRNCWFHTGDGLKRDEEGWYYFLDRIKDALRRRGENISSFEVEHAVAGHPDVREVAVVAAPADFEGGEDEVVAVVVLEPGGDVKALAQWAGETMPKFLVPRYWRVLDELPKTPSEKIQKGALRKQGIGDAFDREA
jgi:crotonobetaine/carnitine-CoA ligase